MKINGIGSAKTMPDMASFNVGVTSENVNLESAQRENATKTSELINSLIQMEINQKQIKTASYTIEPIYDYEEGKQIFRGYRISNILSVIVSDLMQIGKIIDNATAAGANRVENINFSVSNATLYYGHALNYAVKDAVRKATQLAQEIGVFINETPCQITEETLEVPFSESAVLRLTAATTPILPGQIEITARVEAVFEYSL